MLYVGWVVCKQLGLARSQYNMKKHSQFYIEINRVYFFERQFCAAAGQYLGSLIRCQYKTEKPGKVYPEIINKV